MALNDPFTLDLFGNTVALVRPRPWRHSLPRRGEPDDADRAVSSRHPPLPFRSRRRFEAGDRSRREFPSRRRPRACKELARSRAREHRRDPARSGRSRPNIVRATAEEQAQLIRFTGFGASELANGVFRRPGEDAFRKGWEEIGGELEGVVDARSYASLARCTQYAHFTPEYIVRAVWAAVHAARLPRRPGARARHRQRPVSGVDAGSAARRLPRHRRRARSGDRADREALAAAGAGSSTRISRGSS